MKGYSDLTIPVEKILVTETYQTHSEGKGIEKLKKSIEQYDMIQPILVTFIQENGKTTGTYVLLDGFKRLEAIKQLGRKEIPARVFLDVPTSDENEDKADSQEDGLCLTFASNLVREKVSIDKLEAAVLHLHNLGWGYKKIADHIGYSKPGVQKILNRIKRFNASLPAEVQREHRLLKRAQNVIRQLSTSSFGVDSEVVGAINRVKTALEKRIDEISELLVSSTESAANRR